MAILKLNWLILQQIFSGMHLNRIRIFRKTGSMLFCDYANIWKHYRLAGICRTSN